MLNHYFLVLFALHSIVCATWFRYSVFPDPSDPDVPYLAPLRVAGDILGNWMGLPTYYACVDFTCSRPTLVLTQIISENWQFTQLTIPPEATVNCSAGTIRFVLPLGLTSSGALTFAATFAALVVEFTDIPSCVCYVTAISTNNGLTWTWSAWDGCSRGMEAELPTLSPGHLPLVAEFYWNSPSFDVAGDLEGNFVFAAAGLSSAFLIYYNHNSGQYSTNFFNKDSLSNNNNISLDNFKVVPGPPGVWLVVGYSSLDTGLVPTSEVYLFFSNNSGATWYFERYPTLSGFFIMGLSVVTNKMGTWLMCSFNQYYNVETKELDEISIECDQDSRNSSSMPIFLGYKGETQRIQVSNNSISASWYLGNQEYPVKYNDFMVWVGGYYIIVYGDGYLLKVYSSDGYQWSLPEPLETNSFDIISIYKYSLGAFIKYDGQGMTGVGYIYTEDGTSGHVIWTRSNDMCIQNTHSCDLSTTTCTDGSNPSSSLIGYTCSCKSGLYPTSSIYQCSSESNPCVISNGNCQHICTFNPNQIPSSVCSCYTGYVNTSQTTCGAISLWTIQNYNGPTLSSMGSAAFPDTGLLYLHGVPQQVQLYVPLWQYSLNWDMWVAEASQNAFLPAREDPCLFVLGTSVWMVGGESSVGSVLEIWAYDIIMEIWSQIDLIIKLPALHNPSCTLFQFPGELPTIVVYGGYTYTNNEKIVQDTLYEIVVDESYGTVLNVLTYSNPNVNGSTEKVVWPPRLYQGLFVQISSTLYPAIRSLVLIGGKSNNSLSLTPDQNIGFLYNYTGKGTWMNVPILEKTEKFLPTQGSPYLVNLADNTIFLLDITKYSLLRLIEIKEIQNDNTVPVWAWQPLDSGGYNFSVLNPLFLFSITNIQNRYAPVMGILTDDANQVYTYQTDLLSGTTTAVDTCMVAPDIFCTPPAVCVSTDPLQDGIGFKCTCPQSTILQSDDRSCVAVHNDDTVIIISATVAIIVLLLVGIIVLVYLFNRKLDLKQFPEYLRWPYELYYAKPRKWQPIAIGAKQTFIRTFEQDSKHYKRVITMFTSVLHGESKMGNLEVVAIHAIFNSMLTSQFLSYKKLLELRFRSDPAIFQDQSWRQDSNAKKREFVFDHYTSLVGQFSWNKVDMPEQIMKAIIPVIHGAGLGVAMKVAEKGFVAISKNDSGFYGKGMYFTTHALYALPYFATQQKPVLIITYALPGNPYPVVESHLGQWSLLGRGMVGSHTSHYVLTRRDGLISGMKDTEIYNELVFSQESSLLPVFILEISNKNFAPLIIEFQRKISPIESESSEQDTHENPIHTISKQSDDEVNFQEW